MSHIINHEPIETRTESPISTSTIEENNMPFEVMPHLIESKQLQTCEEVPSSHLIEAPRETYDTNPTLIEAGEGQNTIEVPIIESKNESLELCDCKRQEQIMHQSTETSADQSSLIEDEVQTQECNTQFMLKGASQPHMPRCKGSSKSTIIAMATLFIIMSLSIINGLVVDGGQIISLGEGAGTRVTPTSGNSLRISHIRNESEFIMPIESIEAYGSLEIKSLTKFRTLITMEDTLLKNIEESNSSEAYIKPNNTYHKCGEVPTVQPLRDKDTYHIELYQTDEFLKYSPEFHINYLHYHSYIMGKNLTLLNYANRYRMQKMPLSS